MSSSTSFAAFDIVPPSRRRRATASLCASGPGDGCREEAGVRETAPHRVVVLAVAALVVVVGTASAFATARTVLGGGHP